MDGPEKISKDGQFSDSLIQKSQVVPGSDFNDTVVCPPQVNLCNACIMLNNLPEPVLSKMVNCAAFGNCHYKLITVKARNNVR